MTQVSYESMSWSSPVVIRWVWPHLVAGRGGVPRLRARPAPARPLVLVRPVLQPRLLAPALEQVVLVCGLQEGVAVGGGVHVEGRPLAVRPAAAPAGAADLPLVA